MHQSTYRSSFAAVFAFYTTYLPRDKRGSVFAAIESANIVGYQVTEPKFSTGYNFIIPTFVDVSAKTASYDLQNIKLVDATGDGATEVIMGYNKDARLTGDQWYWNTAEDSFMGLEEDCWVDDALSDVKVEGVTLPLGTGLYLNISTEGAKVQYAGQVPATQVVTEFPTVGYNMIGNSTPIALDLQSIKLQDATGDGATEVIMGYNKDARLTGDQWYWNTAEDSFMGLEEDCWVDDALSDVKVEGCTLAPGEGIYINVATEGAKYVIPSAL